MSANTTTVNRFFELFGRQHDLDAVEECFAPGAIVHFHDMPAMPYMAYKQVGAMYLGAFPDMGVVIEDQFEAGDKIVTRVVWSGTHTGPLMSIPPTGKPILNNELCVDRMVDGKIAERWQISDSLSLMQQLGVIPAPEGM